jgi:hypothetical protein
MIKFLEKEAHAPKDPLLVKLEQLHKEYTEACKKALVVLPSRTADLQVNCLRWKENQGKDKKGRGKTRSSFF